MSVIETLSDSFSRVLATNSTDTSITNPTPTRTRPSGEGYIRLGETNTPNQVQIIFFGTDAANEAFTAQITGWHRCGDLWIPTPLSFATVTLGASTGVAGGLVNASQFFADTIVNTTAYTAAVEVVSGADDTVASITIDTKGASILQVQFDVSTAASANALARGF